MCIHSLRVNRKPVIDRNGKPRNGKAKQIRLHRIALLKNNVIAIAAVPLFPPAPGSHRPESVCTASGRRERNGNLQL